MLKNTSYANKKTMSMILLRASTPGGKVPNKPCRIIRKVFLRFSVSKSNMSLSSSSTSSSSLSSLAIKCFIWIDNLSFTNSGSRDDSIRAHVFFIGCFDVVHRYMWHIIITTHSTSSGVFKRSANCKITSLLILLIRKWDCLFATLSRGNHSTNHHEILYPFLRTFHLKNK